MKELSRRNLLRQSGTLATAVALAGLPRACRAAGANDRIILGKQEGWQYGPRNERRDQMKGQLDGSVHHRDFLDCIRTGRHPHADIEIGHLSATLAHLGNIATRIGRVIHFDPQTEHIIGDDEANGLVHREYRAGHWAVPKGV